MKKIFVTCIAIACILILKADEPGKPVNHDRRVTIQNIVSLKDFTCYWHKHYGDSTITLSGDTMMLIPGSGGAPDGAEFWAVNNKTKKSTDTIYLSNHYDADLVMGLEGVTGNSISYSSTSLSNANKLVETKDTNAVNNKELVKEADAESQKHYTKIILLCTGAALAIGLLVWLYIKRKRKDTAPSQGTGS